MADVELPSDSDESDIDFVPEGEESSDGPSETEDVSESSNVKSAQTKKGKRSSTSSIKTTRSKRNKKDSDDESVNNEKQENKVPTLSTEGDKKSEDDLWASFLSEPVKIPPKIETKPIDKEKDKIPNDTSDKINSVKIDKNKIFGNRPTTAASKSGGLSSILNKIGKNSKLSTLEKSKMDWNTFKKDEDIEEEISTHNRGRSGYLEQQDFLQRTDLRQFEIEKNLRTNKRSNR